MKIYINSFKMYLKSLLEYKTSFITGFLSQILIMFTFYFLILALFDKFDNIQGYTKYEILLCFSIIQFGFSVTETFARGIDTFEKLIINGSFDRLLLRPKNILLQTLSSDFDLIKTSRIIQALIILIISITKLNIEFNPMKIITLILMLLSSIIIFFSIFLLMASYCFITVQGLEIKNLFTDGGKQIAQYPISIYSKHFIFIFTFLIPYGFVNYYPLLYLIGKSNNILYSISPILVFLYLIPAIISFKWGIKKYTSVGS